MIVVLSVSLYPADLQLVQLSPHLSCVHHVKSSLVGGHRSDYQRTELYHRTENLLHLQREI